MKRFIKFYQKDKNIVKMINQSEKGFELIILSDEFLKKLLESINECREEDTIDIIWQMKYKLENFIHYRNCTFSEPIDNLAPKTNNFFLLRQKGFSPMNEDKLMGKRIKVSCNNVSFYTSSEHFKNKPIKKTLNIYKDSILLKRMLKIGEINLKETKNGSLD
jgi:hypothetical protein